MAMRIVGMVMPYQYELGVPDAHQIHVFHRYLSHEFIAQYRLVFRFEA